MTAMVTRQQLNERLDGLRDAMASLRGCTRSERPNERAILQRVFDEICGMHLDYSQCNPSIDERRARLMEQAQEHLRDYL